MSTTSNIKRISLYLLILLIGIVMVWELAYFIPGFLFAITLYIVLRKKYFDLVDNRKWKKPIAALMLITLTLVLLALPVWIVVEILMPKIYYLMNNSTQLISKATAALDQVRHRFPQIHITDKQIQEGVQRASSMVPQVLGTTASIITNIAVAFFVVYFMFVQGREMEDRLEHILPLKQESKNSIWEETHKLIVSNAIGIPILAFLQGIVASIGYWIFNVDGFLVWGLMTGICSLLPVVGTMVVWVPICVYMFASGDAGNAIGLTLFSAIVISNIDNVLRFTIMKRIGNVHPLITVFGVLLGLQLFGIMGLIFGPLLISYFLLMIKIYRSEFGIKD
jgi:predicted PurR-regulated permease PerM